jgi:hypothetical protein
LAEAVGKKPIDSSPARALYLSQRRMIVELRLGSGGRLNIKVAVCYRPFSSLAASLEHCVKGLRERGENNGLESDYDIITVGGGLGGAALAKAMAENGARVLVLERETQFKDRIRGEVIFPWGIAELRQLGIDDRLMSAFALEAPYFDTYLDGARFDHRELKSTTKQQLSALNWVHHEMEEALLQTAEKAGAEVHRGARVCAV